MCSTHRSLFFHPILARELKGYALRLPVQPGGLTLPLRSLAIQGFHDTEHGLGDLSFLSRRLELCLGRRTFANGLQLRRCLFLRDANRGGNEDLSLAGVFGDHCDSV